jgi:hypothetical protein
MAVSLLVSEEEVLAVCRPEIRPVSLGLFDRGHGRVLMPDKGDRQSLEDVEDFLFGFGYRQGLLLRTMSQRKTINQRASIRKTNFGEGGFAGPSSRIKRIEFRIPIGYISVRRFRTRRTPL